jgi:mevalonate kinase
MPGETKNFETEVHGKWILAGEHAVLRGSPALVFPLYSRSLHFSFSPTQQKYDDGLRLELSGEHGDELQLLFWGVLEKACMMKKLGRKDIAGLVKIRSTIPVGAGLGASAALSVAFARWFQHLKVLQENELQEFARNLENLFHGESSGLDVAVALNAKPLRFVRGIPVSASAFFTPSWTPKWYVSYSGKRGVTSECVNGVKNWIAKNPEQGVAADEDMRSAVHLAEKALASSEQEGFSLLRESFELAGSCFSRWNLTEGSLGQHMQWLKNQGAVAMKPTGSGNGGYVLSLWKSDPSAETLKKLIPCF